MEMAAIIGALLCVLTGCLTEKQAYASIDWVTIFLFAGMMPVSSAMDKTGAGKLIAEWTVGLMGGAPSPLVVTGVLFILSCGLTQFMSNTASAALLCPIGVAISKQLGADPKAEFSIVTIPQREWDLVETPLNIISRQEIYADGQIQHSAVCPPIRAHRHIRVWMRCTWLLTPIIFGCPTMCGTYSPICSDSISCSVHSTSVRHWLHWAR